MGSGDGHRNRVRQAARAFSVAIAAVVGLLSLPLAIAIAAPAPSGTSDLSLTKSDSPDPVFAGAPLAYSIRVSNAGPDTATNTVVTDNLPKDTGFVSAQAAQGSCSVSGNHRTVTCKIGTLAPVSGPQYGPQYNPAPATITINVLAPAKVGKKREHDHQHGLGDQ